MPKAWLVDPERESEPGGVRSLAAALAGTGGHRALRPRPGLNLSPSSLSPNSEVPGLWPWLASALR